MINTMHKIRKIHKFHKDFKKYKDKIFHRYLYQVFLLELIFGWICCLLAYLFWDEFPNFIIIRGLILPPIFLYFSMTRSNWTMLFLLSGETGNWIFLWGFAGPWQLNPILMVQGGLICWLCKLFASWSILEAVI